MAQDSQKTTPRGIQAGNSYSISDIETINTTTGNMMLNLPLAKLPAGRGGLSAGVGLMYNSKLWDLNVHPYPSVECGRDPGCVPVQLELHTLKPSLDGGWQYAIRYKLRSNGTGHDYTSDPPSGLPCTAQLPGGWSTPVLVTPDGSEHDLHIQGDRALYAQTDGSYPFTFDGTPLDGHCHREAPDRPAAGTVLTYFTIDGSFLRLDVTVGTTSDASTWMLYSPDGTRVTGGLDTTGNLGAPDQRIYDRNGNYIDISTDADYNSTGHVADLMTDQLGRQIVIEYGTGTDQDTVSMSGFGGAALNWTVHWKTIYVNQKYLWGFAGNTTPGNLLARSFRVVDSIALPSPLNHLSYTFTYNGNDSDTQSPFYSSTGWGEVSSITTPMGATATYAYKRDDPGTGLKPEEVLNNFPKTKTLTYKCEYDTACGSVAPGDNVTEEWDYDYFFGDSSSDPLHGWSTVTGPDGGVTKQEFVTTGEDISMPVGQPYRTTNPDGTVIERIWAENKPAATYNLPADHPPLVNPYVTTEFTTIKNYAGSAVLTAIKDTGLDKNGNTTKVSQYDFVAASSISRDSFGLPTGIPSGIHPARVSVTNFSADTPDATDHTTASDHAYYATAGGGYPRFLQAVASSEAHSVSSGGSETPVTRVENTYDNALTTGNLTTVKTWDSDKGGSSQAYSNPLTSGNSISVSTAYNSYGMPTSATDANGAVTQITYGYIASGSSVNNLYPTQTVTAYGTSVAKTATAAYDFYTGAVTTATDADNSVSTVTEYDALARPTLVKAAYGTPVETRTAMTYDDDDRLMITRSDLETAGDGKLVKIEHLDQLGRPWLVRALENPGTQSATDTTAGIKVQTRYGFVNSGSDHYSFQITSNPYRADSSADATAEPTMGWSRSIAFSDGKRSEIETFAGVTVPQPGASGLASTGKVTTLRDGNKTYVRDQADKWRMSETNGLGELFKVTEDPTSSISGYTHSGTDLLTEYSYDTLSNLIGVSMAYSGGMQTRSFTYSSVARLLSAVNPESGTISYQYDGNGNLTSKADARSVHTTYAYDALNRPTSRTYDDGTPTVTYTYDGSGVAYGKGKLASVSSSVSGAALFTTSYTAYDAAGKLLGSSQTTDGLTVCSGGSAACTMSYQYNLAGVLTGETYPSGREVHHNYTSDGKLAAVSSRTAVNRPFKSYAQGFVYNAAGGVTDMQLGNMRWESTVFNSRMQPTAIALGTTQGATDLLNLGYAYDDGTNHDKNNGNVITQTIGVLSVGAAPGFVATQSYTYDELNRLKSATENSTPTGGSAAQSWKQTYLFDRFGNRTFDTSSGATTTLPSGFNAHIYNPMVDPSNNQFSGGQDYTYDAAGNVTQDASGKKFVYDGENKQISFGTGGSSTNGGTYFYDGDGHRVKKIVGTEVTVFLYDAGGQMVAEYTTTAPSSPQVNYLTADTLGTPRINTDANGSVIARHDYMPFGEEIEPTGNRSSVVSYVADTVRQKFTSKERDLESNLDYFQARFYCRDLARFTSPDPLSIDKKRLIDPQQMDLYVYVRNNPLNFVDPDGLDFKVKGKAQDDYVKTLDIATPSFSVAEDAKTHKIEIVDSGGKALDKKQLDALGKTLKGGEKELFTAITDQDHHVTIDTTKNDPKVFIGEFVGKGNQKIDMGDVEQLNSDSNAGGFSAAQAVMHESIEAYAAVTGGSQMSDRDAFNYAHNYANQFPEAGGLEAVPNSARGLPDNKGRLSTATADFTVTGSPGVTERFTIKYSKRVSVESLPRPGNIIGVTKLP